MKDHITVIFTRRRHLGSVVLRAWMGSRFSHCALVDPATGTIIEAAMHGVRERPLADLIAESSYHEIIQIPCHDAAMVLAAVRAQIGKPYDWRGILGFWFRRNWQDDNAFLCSELIAWGLHTTGNAAFRRGAHRISPEVLYLPLFERS